MIQIEEKILLALRSQQPLSDLRQFAQQLVVLGFSQDEIYSGFLKVHKSLQAQGMENDLNVIGDVMDMIMGWYPPHNLKFDK